MPEHFELTVLPLHRRDGQDSSYIPGLLAAEPPRRAARGRGEERLLLQLSLPPEMALTPEAQQTLLQDMADGYFRAPGAVTSALREQVERLNAYFLQKNQQVAKSGAPAPALLSLLSVREGRVTLAQCGPVQGFVLQGDDIQHFYDPQNAGRGLGLSQTTDIRFFQFELQLGSLILLMPDLPSGWNEKTLSGVQGQKLATLRRRFLSEAGPNLQAVMLSAQPGKPGFHMLTGQDLEAAEARERTPVQPNVVTARRAQFPTRPATESTAWEAVEVPAASEAAQAFEAESEPGSEETAAPITPLQPEADHVQQANWREAITARMAALSQRVGPPLRSFLQRVLPEEPIFNLPPRTMGLIAVLVPLAVVVLVVIVYLQFGRVQLYVNYLERAQSAAALAAASQDPEEIRTAWNGVVFYAERAAAYEEDAQTAATLLAQAKTALDDMDAIQRVEFGPALFDPLPRDAVITRMVADNSDLYMLNATDGKILHAFLAGDGASGGYQLDSEFSCEPGQYGDFIVSELIDMALLPRGNAQNADLLAMDGNGNLIYCAQGERPSGRALIPPDNNWGQPLAISVENGNLYVLDPLINAVWVFFGEDYSYVDEPRFFFGAEVPNLRQMLDLDMQDDTLYLIAEDGHMVICEFSDDLDNPSTCENSVEFTDTRPGRENGAQIADAHFLQMEISEPPQPAIYMLDPVARAVYRFSLQLNLDLQFQSDLELPEGQLTAFAITPNRAIFLALNNEIFIGFMPSER